ncbi:DNA alkylation repair protein [Luteipulveratus mongoliensis]|uniref:DNA alkylation repair protein n=1 Tax=Luteipulveratus mongoliensis TaxID=571913 RepID=A0A0K1JGJ3_9MICO|nr:DNA alkylation repair protein [Luteipulveratus mongoliensis]AKU15842.1 DNA alkylation repair protein [Luteipulveratus mongoliensis]
MTSGPELVTAIRDVVRAHGDPVRAEGQQRYMKSAMPYRGITSPELKALLRPLLAERVEDRAEWESAVRSLFDGATHREEWYAALALLRHRHYRSWRDSEVMPLVRHLIRSGAWWDVVDEASHVVAEVGLLDPAGEGRRLREWSRDDDMWVRRAAIIGQLGAKERTDVNLLEAVIVPNLDSREFFIRKAIGWALREYAKTSPDWVRAFVDAQGEQMSGLTRREAMKHL